MFDSNHVEHPYHFVLRKKVTEATKSRVNLTITQLSFLCSKLDGKKKKHYKGTYRGFHDRVYDKSFVIWVHTLSEAEIMVLICNSL